MALGGERLPRATTPNASNHRGGCAFSRSALVADEGKARPYLLDIGFRLLEGGKVAAPRALIPIDDLGVNALSKTLAGAENFLWK